MSIQTGFVLIFALNMLLLNQFKWYRWPGSFVFALLPFVTVFFSQPRFELDYFWWRIAGVIAITLGVALIVWAKRHFKEGTLITSGPYQHLRHPIYLGLIFIFLGWWWIWAGVYSFYFGMFILGLIWIQGYLEEKFVLEKQFGKKFREYWSTTGMFWIK